MPLNLCSWLKKAALLVPILALLYATGANAQCRYQKYDPYLDTPVAARHYVYDCNGSNSVYIQRVATYKGMVNFSKVSLCDESSGTAGDTNNYNYLSDVNTYCKAAAGSTVDIFVQPLLVGGVSPSSVVRVSVWIDWNHNEIFEEGQGYSEQVIFKAAAAGNPNGNQPNPGGAALTNGIIGSGVNQGATWTFEIPKTAKNGPTRMRVRVGAGGPPGAGSSLTPAGLTACGQAMHGETEDYTFEIVSQCLPPATLSVSEISCTGAEICWSSVANADLYDYWVDTCMKPGCSIRDQWGNPLSDSIKTYYFGFPLSNQFCRTVPNVTYQQILPETKYYIAVRSTCDSIKKPSSQYWQNSDWIIDSFETLPCCDNPENIYIKDTTSTTAVIFWNPVYTSYMYEYSVNTTPNNPPEAGNKTTSTTVTLTGLSAAKVYYFCVKALCRPTPISDWVCQPFATKDPLSIIDIDVTPKVEAYPNPVTNVVTVSVEEFSARGTIAITDIAGKTVYTTNVTASKTDIDMSTFSKGLYLIKYASDNGSKVIKITKQ